jgi:methylmalonyl-CoA mutase
MDNLFSAFAAVDAHTWKQRLEKDLKGVTFEDLSVLDSNGITIEDRSIENTVSFTHNDWDIIAEINEPEATKANTIALSQLEGGATGLRFIVEAHTPLEVLLKDILLPHIAVQFQVRGLADEFVQGLEIYINAKGWAKETLNIMLALDVIAHAINEQELDIVPLQQAVSNMLRCNQTLVINGIHYQNAGATTSSQISLIVAQVNEYLHYCSQAKLLDKISRIVLYTATGTLFFEEIAKLRALRQAVTLLCGNYHIHPLLNIHVDTSNLYRAPFDVYTNLLRDTLSGMAAVIGGCDSLLVRHFNEQNALPTPFSYRMSRNIQLILKEESYLNKVADIGAGAYYIETLTTAIGNSAWEQFKEIEASGGLLSNAISGTLYKTINTQAEALLDEYRSGKKVLIGVNKYPNPTDMPTTTIKASTSTKGLQAIALATAIL